MVISELTDFFEAVRREELPLVRDDLQHHAAGCYAAVSMVKTAIRRAECEAVESETFNALARAALGKPGASPREFEAVWKNILFAHFHDSMGGCSAKFVHENTVMQLSESRSRAEKIKNNALQTLAWKIDTRDAAKGYPVVIFNPHPWPVEETVRLNGPFTVLTDGEGNAVPTQIVHSPSARCRMAIGDALFRAKVPALGYTCYYRQIERAPYLYDAPEKELFENGVRMEGFRMENEYLLVTLDPEKGTVSSLFDKTLSRELLRGEGGKGVVIDESDRDTWSHGKTFFDREIGAFSAVSAEVQEAGPVRAVIKVTSRWGSSTLSQYYTLVQGSRFLEVRCKLDWHEARKMLKLRWETAVTDPKAYYEIPFGVMERPADGEEEPGQTWIALRGAAFGAAMVNDCKYSFSMKEGDLNLTAIRSPYYNDHARGDQEDPESELSDQGETEFSYALRAMAPAEGWGRLVREAHAFNTPCTAILDYNHQGTLPTSACALSLSAENVELSALKRREDDRGWVVRLYETDGKETPFTLSGSLLPLPLTDTLPPFHVRTYTLPDGAAAWQPVLMTEWEA